MECIECKKAISGRHVANRFWKTYLCESCVIGQVCAWCHQFGGCEQFEGVDMCRECRRHIIDTPEELDDLKIEALTLISRHIGPNNLDKIPVLLKKEAEFGERASVLGAAASRKDLTLLFLESGIPDSFALAVLCHEFGHAMLFRNHETLEMRATGGRHELMIEEGFCEVLSALALQSRTDSVARWQSFLMPVNPDPIYGDGFRLMWKAAQEAGSVASLLELVSGDPVSFRGPRLDSVVDDDLDDEELIAVAEAGRGDPTKGPLRGTALRIEEAPKDAPRGPRLRGTALTVAREHEHEGVEAKKGVLRGAGLAIARVKEEEEKSRIKLPVSSVKSKSETSSRLRGRDLE